MSKDSDPKQALIYSQRAARLSRNPQVLDTYGMVLLANQRAETAVKILRIAAKGDSNNTEIQLHLAEALVAAEQPEQAKQILDSLAATEKTAEQSENIRQLRNKL